ncbi:MAG: glycosyltransferase WbuB [Acidimicrobiales bacterium]|nr:glycosyltransferase WbuB [Acidimicrobiales bacterium]
MGATFKKYSPVARFSQEREYAKRFLEVARRFEPTVVIESNDPLLSKSIIARSLAKQGVDWLFWLQDLYSVAMSGELENRLGRAGRLAGRLPMAIEGRLLRQAAAVVPITADFDPRLDGWRVPAANRTVIANWAPIDEITPLPHNDTWVRGHGIEARQVVLYAGTLGLKHDPSLLLHLATGLEARDVAVVVVSEGAGADWLREHGANQPNLHVLPYQPYEQLALMFSNADVGITILNGAAGVYSVPSKLLSYLCAGCPVVAAIPAVNQAAEILDASGGGIVVPPDDGAALLSAVEEMLSDDERREAAGRAGRTYAEENFDVRRIADQFMQVIDRFSPRDPNPVLDGDEGVEART